MKIPFLTFYVACSAVVFAQTDNRVPCESNKKYSWDSYSHYLDGIKAYNIGPTVMSGRVVDVEVDPSNDAHFYAAFATGGLWETTNNGTSFTSIFNNQSTFGIGDIAVDWKSKKIYVGTGENNSSRSSYAGKGVFVSEDNGKTWKNLGLEETHHIGRIVINSENPNEIIVGAIGHLFTYNKERGIYKSLDGGKTWKQTLFINEKTGVIDVIADPQNSKIVYAAAWQRERVAWNFEESGEGSGIYKSVDGGETWNLISTSQSNFPQGKGVGRIGLAVSYQNSNIVYAFLDNQDHQEPGKGNAENKDKLTKEQLKSITKENFLKLPPDQIEDYLRSNNFPNKYTAELVRKLVKTDKVKPLALVEYLEDANTMLFDTPVKGAELYRSEDGGKTWKKTHEGYLDNMVFTYGYYFGQVRVHPKNHDRVYLAAFFVAASNDGGKSFTNLNGANVHVDHHALWINPNREGHLVNGNDGGINISYDNGKTWLKCNNLPVGQFYTVAVDGEENYNVYGGLQDNGVWWGSHSYTAGDGWMMEGKNPYQTIMGGDGMQVQVDPRDNNTIYTGYQFGNYFRVNKSTGENTYITPKHELGERPLRYNWQAPIHLSVHQNDVIYIGANKLYRSFNKGNDFKPISPDLTGGGMEGDVAYGTITALHESPLRFGLLYVGSDDGFVYSTKDGGATWTNCSNPLPPNFWVRRLVASSHLESRVYVCLNGHTKDHFASMLYVSDDYGQNWSILNNGLPNFPVNVIREDPENENLLYVGTDIGLYVSIDRGNYFFPVTNNFPVVPVHDLAIQDKAADLVVATHGQSLFKVDLEQLRQLAKRENNSSLMILPIEDINRNPYWGNEQKWFNPAVEEPEVSVYYFNDGNESEGSFVLKDSEGEIILEQKPSIKKGLQRIPIVLSVDTPIAQNINTKYKKKNQTEKFLMAQNGKYYFSPGKYTVSITINGKTITESLEVKENKNE